MQLRHATGQLFGRLVPAVGQPGGVPNHVGRANLDAAHPAAHVDDHSLDAPPAPDGCLARIQHVRRAPAVGVPGD
eukprot:864699-Prymnesium_polylepis.1